VAAKNSEKQVRVNAEHGTISWKPMEGMTEVLSLPANSKPDFEVIYRVFACVSASPADDSGTSWISGVCECLLLSFSFVA